MKPAGSEKFTTIHWRLIRRLALSFRLLKNFWTQGYVLYPEDPEEGEYVAFADFYKFSGRHSSKTESGKFQLFQSDH